MNGLLDLLKGLTGYALMCVLAVGVLAVVAVLMTAASYAPLAVGLVALVGGVAWLSRG